jgi:tetratricopeptide (TPR) repeat protein
MAVRTLGFICIAQGRYQHGLEIARRSLAAGPDEPEFLTMTGFFLEQSGYNDAGLSASLRSLALDPTNLYTYHAVGHADQARGDYRQALETFARAASLEHYPHMLWHPPAQAILGHERPTRDYWAAFFPSAFVRTHRTSLVLGTAAAIVRRCGKPSPRGTPAHRPTT